MASVSGSQYLELKRGSWAFKLVANRSIVRGPNLLFIKLKIAGCNIQLCVSGDRLSLSALIFFIPGI